MERITQKDLEMLCERLNHLAGIKDDIKYNTIGAYVLDYAYGGVELQIISNPHGGVRDVSTNGHGTKRQLYEFMCAYISGMEENQAN